MTGAPATGRDVDPLGTIPLFDVNSLLTSPAVPDGTLAGLAAIEGLRRDLDQREHDLITEARTAGATWQQIATSLGFKDRQAAQQRQRALARILAAEPRPSQTRTPRN
jgi:hypothetical protein